MKRAKRLSADDLIRTTKAMFTKYGLPKNKVSDAGTNFMSDYLKQ